MASLLRSIVSGPRSRHPEADLDLCYVTSDIIATSGPSQTYPQRAYRNPLDKLVEFLDERHGQDWAIWEFRAEGTGYPDDLVYGRVRHYPWPDHHPPPFRLIPMIMASMRNWLHGGDLHDGKTTRPPGAAASSPTDSQLQAPLDPDRRASTTLDKAKFPRVAVVHCKAGKGRSGTIACSYLMSECGWRPEEALTRFTERRMRPKFGAGVSIPSQLRTITYVDRWTRNRKRYVDRPVEIVEIHVWGLRDGVKVDVEGYADGGRRIEVFHTFKKAERLIVEGTPPEAGGMADMMFDLAGLPVARAIEGAPDEAHFSESTNLEDPNGEKARQAEEERRKAEAEASAAAGNNEKGRDGGLQRSSSRMKLGNRTATLIQQARTKTGLSRNTASQTNNIPKLHDVAAADSAASSSSHNVSTSDPEAENAATESEPGGMAVILRPSKPVRVPNSDVNISVERRNKSPSSLGFTMVTAVAHVWFNAFFEGNGPEQEGRADSSGVFNIDWDAMDGIKGSSRKGARALDRIAVVWRVPGAAGGAEKERPSAAAAEAEAEVEVGEEVLEPEEGIPVPQMEAADWKGGNREDPDVDKALGLRPQNPESADVSKASSVKSQDLRDGAGGPDTAAGERQQRAAADADANDDDQGARDTDSMAGVRVSGPGGEEELTRVEAAVAAATQGTDEQQQQQQQQPGQDLLGKPDTASGTTAGSSTEVKR